jgi:hypothetical protein
MGSDARATICFGIVLDNETEYPWSDDIEDWWFNAVCGYIPPFRVFDEKGNFLNGIQDEKCDEYYNHKNGFKKAHPLPVELIYQGYGDEPSPILSVLKTKLSTEWDAALEIPYHLEVKEENLKAFTEFCKTHLNTDEKPKWLLSAYYG